MQTILRVFFIHILPRAFDSAPCGIWYGPWSLICSSRKKIGGAKSVGRGHRVVLVEG